MHFGRSFTRQRCFVRLKTPTFEKGFQSERFCSYLCKFVKTATSCACVLCVCAQVHSVSLQSDIAIYWPGIHNTEFLVVFVDFLWMGIVLTTSSSGRKTFQKRKGKFLLHCCRVNVPWAFVFINKFTKNRCFTNPGGLWGNCRRFESCWKLIEIIKM